MIRLLVRCAQLMVFFFCTLWFIFPIRLVHRMYGPDTSALLVESLIGLIAILLGKFAFKYVMTTVEFARRDIVGDIEGHVSKFNRVTLLLDFERLSLYHCVLRMDRKKGPFTVEEYSLLVVLGGKMQGQT